VKKKRKITLAVILLLIVLAVAALAIHGNRNYRYVSGYTDKNGNVYRCSKTIKAKVYNAGKPDLEYFVPLNPSDANLYCHQIGVS
jgi:hypothetical protein